MEFINRFFQDSDQSFLLFGPRGTGKSTWIENNCKDALIIDLLLPDVYRFYQAKPERLIEVVRGNPEKKDIVIDEIQKIPELLSVVHYLIEHERLHRYILTGSSARKLKRTGVNLLGGRVLLKKMHPFMAAEIKNYFNIEKAITHGMLPVVLDSKYPEEVLKSYAALYLKEEVQAEGLTRNLGNFARFLEIISFSHGSMLNISNVARECEIHRKVVESYITILEDLLIASRIDVFSRRAKRALTSHAKFYIFDAGVFASLRPSGPFDHPQDIQGASLEGLVFQHLLAYKDYAQGKNEIYYWRTRSGVEVDFIVYGACGLWGIEVKNTERIRTEDLKPLKIYSQEYPESKLIFLYRGKQRMQIENILVVPCEEFLLQLYPGRLSENL